MNGKTYTKHPIVSKASKNGSRRTGGRALLLALILALTAASHAVYGAILTVSSSPSGAKVFINDLYKGRTTCQIEFTLSGWYAIRVEKEGYKPLKSDIVLYPIGGNASRNFELIPSKTTARLPKPMPTPSRLEQLLKQADAYFDKQQFMTPAKTNAFAMYQAVLKLDPKNAHAKDKLQAMLAKYKNWGDENYKQANYAKAKAHYERYLEIAEYLINNVGDVSRGFEFVGVRQQLQALEANLMAKPTETPQKPTPTPQAELLPVITLSSDIPAETDRATLTVAGAATAARGIAKVNVQVERPGAKGLQITPLLEQQQGTFETDVQLAIGANTIVIAATDTAGKVGQRNFTVIRTAAKPPVAAEPTPAPGALQNAAANVTARPDKVYAVIIGIGAYQDQNIRPLDFTVNDAQSLYDVLTDPQYGGVPKAQVTLLLDKEATARNIKTAIGKWLRQQAGPEDTIIIYYSGHGAPEEGNTYWVTHDAELKNLFATALDNNDIHDMLARLASKRVITFLDACYSAATVQAGDQTRSLATEIPWDKFAGEGRVAISASDGKQLSLELDEFRHGVFTYYLLDGLKGKADANQDGVVEVDEIWNYVKSQVTDAARKAGNSQTPVFQGTVTAGIPLTFNVPLLEERRRQASFEVKKDAIAKLRREQKISVELFNKALDMLEKGGADPILDDFLNGKISLERFKATF